jgi:hypothetical protein
VIMGKICIGLTIPTPPSLPTGFSFPLPPLPGIPNVELCCQIRLSDYIPDPAELIGPLPFAAYVAQTGASIKAYITAVNAIIEQGQQAVQEYVDSIVPECPKMPRTFS